MEIKQKGINNECKSYNKIGLSRSGRDPRRRHLLYGIHNHALMPGCEILQSFDLVHWEHVTYVYETLDHTDAQQLKSGQNIYGQGMWAASLRYHEGRFYICFVANDTRKTYLYTSEKIDGPWKKQLIEGFYHDGSLLFDEDGRNYIVYGNDEIWITELNEDLTAPKKDGYIVF